MDGLSLSLTHFPPQPKQLVHFLPHNKVSCDYGTLPVTGRFPDGKFTDGKFQAVNGDKITGKTYYKSPINCQFCDLNVIRNPFLA